MRRLVLFSLFLAACHGSPTEPRFDAAVLRGRVVFTETGTPAAGARVVAHFLPIAHGDSTEVATVTDANGSYAFTNLVGGQYMISAYKAGSSARSVQRLI